MGINEQFFSSYIQGQYERAISQLYILIFVGKKVKIVGNHLLRINVDTLHSLSKLFASARYTVKTVPDKLLNLCIEKHSKLNLHQEILSGNDHMKMKSTKYYKYKSRV